MNQEELFSHNIGVITADEQAVLADTCVAIAGVGGVGGNVAHYTCTFRGLPIFSGRP